MTHSNDSPGGTGERERLRVAWSGTPEFPDQGVEPDLQVVHRRDELWEEIAAYNRAHFDMGDSR